MFVSSGLGLGLVQGAIPCLVLLTARTLYVYRRHVV